MTYIVTWAVAAQLQLGRIAATLADPDEAEREALWMDTILRRYPLSMGESRWGKFRLWYGDKIGIWYSVDDTAMTVRIVSVGPARRR